MQAPDAFWTNGPKPGGFYCPPGEPSNLNTPANDVSKRTMQPMVTGTSVLGIQYDGGIILAADTLGSYGSMARFRNVSRIMQVNKCTVLGASGDYADYQNIKSILDQMVIDDDVLDDGFYMRPDSVHSWMTRVMYNKRTRFNPFWNTVVIGGHENGRNFLGYVDKIGIAYEAESIATGFGAYIAQPLMRKVLEEHKGALDKETALQTIQDCLKVLFYRDARSYNRFEIAIVNEQGVEISKPLSANTDWQVAHYVKGFE